VARILLSSIRFFRNWNTMSQQKSRMAPTKPRKDKKEVYDKMKHKKIVTAIKFR